MNRLFKRCYSSELNDIKDKIDKLSSKMHQFEMDYNDKQFKYYEKLHKIECHSVMLKIFVVVSIVTTPFYVYYTNKKQLKDIK
jgi:uncharacterized sporulation protein YeaH/YhbH (DUF444 family)